jgi:RNA ligase
LEKDLLIKQKHPTKDLWILNYSKTCQYSRAWDEVTLSCRGLVVNGAGTIVARPFSKFFNKEEHEARVDAEGLFTDGEGVEAYLKSDTIGTIPTDLPFEVFEKMDGSLGLLFYYNGWEFASRGSFTSEQADKGAELINRMTVYLYGLSKDHTYIFEIIYPENRIVIDYGTVEKLVLLGVIETVTGEEMSYDEVLGRFVNKFEIVPRYDGIKDFTLLKGMEEDNKEGFVVLFSNGFRMKVKFEEYCRLHAIVTNVSNKIIWKHLMNDESFEDLLDRVPDEFYDWVFKTKKELEDAYHLIERTCHGYMGNTMIDLCKLDRKVTKKDFALKVKDHKYSGILFTIWDKKDYSQTIWKLVKPTYCPAFKEVVEE